MNLARSTVQRIVAALQAEQLVISATPNGRIRLGPTILRLAASLSSDFLALARPVLERLSNELHETVDLSVVKKDHLIFIDQVSGSQRLRTVSAVGEAFPLIAPLTARHILHDFPMPMSTHWLDAHMPHVRRHSLTRLDTLLKELPSFGATASLLTARSTRSASAPRASPSAILLAIRSQFQYRCRRNALPTRR